MRSLDGVRNSRDTPPCLAGRVEQERLSRGGPSFGPFVANQTKPNNPTQTKPTKTPRDELIKGMRAIERGFLHMLKHDMFHDTVCLFNSPDLPGRRAQGTKNEILSHRDPQKVSKPKYEATALCSHRSIGYPNPTNGQYVQKRTCPLEEYLNTIIRLLKEPLESEAKNPSRSITGFPLDDKNGFNNASRSLMFDCLAGKASRDYSDVIID